MIPKKKKRLYVAIGILCLIFLLYAASGWILSSIGEFLVVDEAPVHCDAVVVLNTGVEYYPRLMEAANLYKLGLVKRVVINGNRKTDTLRDLERKGFTPCCEWYEDRVRILVMLGVKEKDILPVSAEDAYDSVSEAQVVGKKLMETGISRIIITTSKYHTRRARFVWKSIYGNHLEITTVTAKSDPYDPEGWWKIGRQIRWVLAEYGAWIYDFWKSVRKEDEQGE